MPYTVEFGAKAARQFRKLGPAVRERLQPAIDALAMTPFPPGTQKLQGREGFRLRVGKYRVLYEVHQARLLVLVVEVGHRRDVYRRR